MFADLVLISHPFFTRHVRWCLIFFDIYLSLLQIVCLLELSSDPVKIPRNQSILVYAFSRFWICLATSVMTQTVIFGVAYLYRINEEKHTDVTQWKTYEEYKSNLRKTKLSRSLTFYFLFLVLTVTTYLYVINFSLTHSNDVAIAWIILLGVTLICDFLVADVVLIIVQLWINGISSRYEQKVFRLRCLKVARNLS